MAMTKIKKGDTVKVIAGKDLGAEGKVKKHSKPSMANQDGGIIERESYIDASNVMYVHKGQAVRVGFEVKDGKKVRVAKVNGKREVID